MARQKAAAPAETARQNADGIIGAEGNRVGSQVGNLVVVRKVLARRAARFVENPLPHVIARLVLAIDRATGTFKINGFRA